MTTETTYGPWDLERGECVCCGEVSDIIVKGTDTCADCIEDQKFYEESMRDLPDYDNE